MYITAFFVLVMAGTGQTAADDRQVVEAIRTAYVANRAALTFGTIRFRRTSGEAPDVAAADRGEWARRFIAEGLFVFDGKNARYECVFPAEDIVADRVKVGDNQWRSTIESVRVLTDGRVTLWDRPFLPEDGKSVSHSAQIDPGTAIFYEYAKVPLELGNPDPRGTEIDFYLRKAEKGEGGWRLAGVDDSARLDDRDVVLLTLEAAMGTATVRLRYWVDLECAAIPRRTVMETKAGGVESSFEVRAAEIRRVGDRAWFPFRQTVFTLPKRAVQFEVVEADFDHHPRRSEFRMEFPEPRPLLDVARQVRYDPRKTWDLSALPSPGARGGRRVKFSEPKPSPVLPGPRPPRPRWLIPVFALGLVLVLAAAVMAVRRRRHAA